MIAHSSPPAFPCPLALQGVDNTAAPRSHPTPTGDATAAAAAPVPEAGAAAAADGPDCAAWCALKQQPTPDSKRLKTLQRLSMPQGKAFHVFDKPIMSAMTILEMCLAGHKVAGPDLFMTPFTPFRPGGCMHLHQQVLYLVRQQPVVSVDAGQAVAVAADGRNVDVRSRVALLQCIMCQGHASAKCIDCALFTQPKGNVRWSAQASVL